MEGRHRQLFPVRSALEEAQHTRRDVWEVRGGVTLTALEALVAHLGGLREGRKSVLFVSHGPFMGRRGGSPTTSAIGSPVSIARRTSTLAVGRPVLVQAVFAAGAVAGP